MPVYSYKCRECGQTFHERQRMTDEPYRQIAHQANGQPCDGEVVRIITGAAVHFKGFGFHNTDYSRK